jgi:hypothetical protein
MTTASNASVGMSFLTVGRESPIVEFLPRTARIARACSIDELRGRMAPEESTFIVLHLRDVRERSGAEIIDAVKGFGPSPHLIVASDLDARECQLLAQLAHAGAELAVLTPDMRLQYGALNRTLRLGSASVITRLITCFAHHVPLRVGHPVVAGIVTSSRRMKVSMFAATTGLPARTISDRLTMAGLPNPHRFLGWVLALHTAWRLERQRMSHQEVAKLAEFPSVRALSEYLTSHVQRSIRAIEDIGFDDLLNWCVAQRTTNRESARTVDGMSNDRRRDASAVVAAVSSVARVPRTAEVSDGVSRPVSLDGRAVQTSDQSRYMATTRS